MPVCCIGTEFSEEFVTGEWADGQVTFHVRKQLTGARCSLAELVQKSHCLGSLLVRLSMRDVFLPSEFEGPSHPVLCLRLRRGGDSEL